MMQIDEMIPMMVSLSEKHAANGPQQPHLTPKYRFDMNVPTTWNEKYWC